MSKRVRIIALGIAGAFILAYVFAGNDLRKALGLALLVWGLALFVAGPLAIASLVTFLKRDSV